MNQREVPFNVEQEQALLGALFVNNDVAGLIDFLLPSHFYEPLHRRIFDTARELIRMGKVANPVTIKTFLPENQKLGDITIAEYLARLAAEAVTVINAIDYAKGIVALSQRRALIVAGQNLIDAAYDAAPEEQPRAIGDRAIEEISAASEMNTETLGAVSFGTALMSSIGMANAAYQRDGVMKGTISYRMSPLDRLIGPLCGGQLIIVGGATKQGKSALVGQIAIGAALDGTPVDFYSGEMTPEELAMREISRRVGIPVNKQKRGELKDAQFEQLIAVHAELKNVPILIQGRRQTLPQLKERWRRVVRKKGKSVLILDHAGLLDRDKATAKMSNWEFGEEVTRELKATARELDCPIIVCVQLKKNTFAENKGPLNERFLNDIIRRKPRYADLIGAVERDADHVVIPFRPEVFLMEHEPTPGGELYGIWEAKVNAWRGKAQLVLALSRERSWPDTVTVGWDGACTSFFEIGDSGDGLPERFRDFVPAGDPMRLI